jgi:hypothetical protein
MTGPDRFEIERLLRWSGFAPFRRTAGRLGVADLFDADARTGIYVLAFNDGSYYVGKASDVTGRYRDHRDAKEPIEAISFRAGPQRLLDAHEQDTIAALELIGVPLKNISLTRTGAPQVADAASWASQDELLRFNTDIAWNNLSGEAYQDEARRAKLVGRFAEIMQRADAHALIDCFALYILRCVPFPLRTAYHRWVISALPSGYDPKAIANLSVGWQWSAVAFENEEGVFLQFYGRGSVLKRSFGRNLEKLAPHYCQAYTPTEVAGGTDQIKLVCRPEEVPALLGQAGVVKALREVAMHLMHRETPYRQSHCFALADAILARSSAMAPSKATT